MSWRVALEIVNAVALRAGVIFAAYQPVELRRQHKRDAVLGLVRSFQSGDFTAALERVNSLPDGADRAAIRTALGPTGEDQVFWVGLTWESLGVLAERMNEREGRHAPIPAHIAHRQWPARQGDRARSRPKSTLTPTRVCAKLLLAAPWLGVASDLARRRTTPEESS